MNLTTQQTAFIERLSSGVSGIALRACAGSGKTTTLVQACSAIPSGNRILALAFNARIKKELEQRMPNHITCLTLNGLGHRTWGRHIGRRCTPDSNRVGEITREVCKEADRADYWNDVRQLVSKAKVHGLVPDGAIGGARGLVPDAFEAWQSIADQYDIECDENTVKLARSVLKRSIQAGFNGDIDFDDQLYLPVVYRSGFDKYNIILVDEAQDLSSIQHEMLARCLHPKGRLIAVGDPHQAIYSFRGAMSNSMTLLADRFHLDWMPLSVSFRCPQSVVQEARKITEDIEPAPDAPDGAVHVLSKWDAETLPYGSAVICRNNGPLLGLAYRLIKHNIGVVYVGRDFGKGLTKIIDKIGAHLPIQDFREQLLNWADRETRNAYGRDAKIQTIQDKRDCLLALMEAGSFEVARDLTEALQKIFSRDSGKVTLSTIHRAKGLEWDNVFFLDSFLVPNSKLLKLYADAPEAYADQLENEYNVRYVAITRAKQSLTYINSEDFQDD